jgi:acetyltransferase-like isoleucine patch superfamily enzyme
LNINVIGPGQLELGQHLRIGEGVQAVFHRPGILRLGDYCTLGDGVKFVCAGGDVALGDWTTLHDRCLVLSGQGVQIGQHGWFGQHCVIDGTGGLYIGNGVRVGMYSQIWSHVAAGEQIEGCTLYGERPVVIEDDVWLVGTCIVASGVTIARRTVALIGSNITRSSEPNSVLAGVPAAPKPQLSFYREVGLPQKWDMLRGWLESLHESLGTTLTLTDHLAVLRWSDGRNEDLVTFAKTRQQADRCSASANHTVCCVEDKRYTKRLTTLEQGVLKALAGNKARFLCEA